MDREAWRATIHGVAKSQTWLSNRTELEHSLALPFFGIGMKTDLFQFCGHGWVFQFCCHIECSTFTASYFRILYSLSGIPSPPVGDNSKNISRNFSGAVVGSVGSVQFQIVPCSSLNLFSRSIGPFQCLVNVNYRVLICCTCHFQNSSLLFVCFGFLCLQVSSVSNFCPDTRGQRWSLI